MQRLSIQRVGHVMLNIGALMFTAWFLLLFFGGVTYGGGVLLVGGLSLAVIGFTVREMSKSSNINWGSLSKNMVVPGLFALGFLLVIVAPLSYFLNIPFVEMGHISVNIMFRLRYIILGLGAAVGSVGVAFDLIKAFQKSRASLHWPTVKGVVADIWPHKLGETKYSYVVNGKKFESDKISLQKGAGNRYLEKKAVTVYYDPDDPSIAVLEPGGGSSLGVTSLRLFLYLVILLLGMTVVVLEIY